MKAVREIFTLNDLTSIVAILIAVGVPAVSAQKINAVENPELLHVSFDKPKGGLRVLPPEMTFANLKLKDFLAKDRLKPDVGSGNDLSLDGPEKLKKRDPVHRIFTADHAMGAAESMCENRNGNIKYRTVEAIPDGKFKTAARGSIVFEAEGNLFLSQGTVSVWFRLHNDAPRRFLTFGGIDEGYYLRLMWLTLSSKDVSLYFSNRHEGRRELKASGFTAKPKEWHHLVLMWDETQGVKVFIDSKLFGSTWGKTSWHAPATPVALGIGGGYGDVRMYNSVLSKAQMSDIDELRVFNRTLSNPEIKGLFETNTPPSKSPAPKLDVRHASHRQAAIGWNVKTRLPILDSAGGTLFRPVPLECYSGRKPRYAQMDGRRGNSRKGAWPFIYQSYKAQETQGLDIVMPEQTTVNVVSHLGRFAGKFTFKSDRNAPGTTVEHDGFSTDQTTVALGKTMPAGHVNIMRNKGQIKDLGLYLWTSGKLGDKPTLRGFLTKAPSTSALPVMHTLFGAGDKDMLTTAASPPASGTLEVRPMRYVHFMMQPVKQAFPLKLVQLRINLASPAPAGRILVSLRDPFNPRGQKIYAAFQFAGGNRINLDLDVNGVMVPAGNRVWVTLMFENGAKIAIGGKGASTLNLVTGNRELVIKTHVREQVFKMLEIGNRQSESADWRHEGRPRSETLRQFKLIEEMCTIMTDLRVWAPDRPELVGHQEWVWDYLWRNLHKDEIPFKYREITTVDLTGPKGAPRWAVLQRELSKLCRDWARWWVENRLDQHGELEGGYNDDTDLVQGWANLIFISDEDRVIRNGLRRLAHAGWDLEKVVNGLGKIEKNILHAYEEGLNMQQLMALTEYGNPVWIERIMETCRHFDRMTEIDKNGKRHFIARRISATTLERSKTDSPYNAMMLQPGLFLSWYNGNEKVTKILTEWTESWITDEDKYLGYRGMAPMSFMLGLYELTGNNRLLSPLYDKTYTMSTQTEGDQLYPEWALNTPLGRRALKNKAYVSYIMNSWQNRMGVRFNGTLFSGNEVPYVKWAIDRDKAVLERKLDAAVIYMRRLFFALTAGNQSTDRIPIPQGLLDRMILGGPACRRLVLWHTHAVSWEGTDGQVASFITRKNRDGVSMVLYNFAEKEKDVAFRVWRLDHGQYEITAGPDSNADDKIDAVKNTRTAELARYYRVPLKIPPRRLWVVNLKQTKKLDSIVQRADLAICADDAKFFAEAGTLTVRIHNIGAKPSDLVAVTLADATGKIIETRQLPSIEAPVDLKPRYSELVFKNIKPGSNVSVSLDPKNTLAEITKINNSVELKCR